MSQAETEIRIENPPTTLHLLRCKGAERNRLQAKVLTTLQLDERFSQTRSSIEKLATEKISMFKRLEQSTLELSTELNIINSSVACGAVFLKMRDELNELSPVEFMDFFKLCLTINTDLTERSGELKGETAFLKTIAMINSRKMPSDLRVILDRVLNSPPAWFKEDKQTWGTFAFIHVNFSFYVNPDLATKTVRRRTGRSLVQDAIESRTSPIPSLTTEGEFPDWFLENNGTIPTKEVIEQELEEDKNQAIKTREGIDGVRKQKNYLAETIQEKIERASLRLLELLRESFPVITNFSDMILFLRIANRKLVKELIQNAIEIYAQDNSAINQEPIALYVEKKLLEGKIIQDSQTQIDNNFINLFTSALEHIKTQRTQGSSETKFQNLRETNKRAFDPLNYDIKPFLEILSPDELSFLQELLSESEGKPIELFIWDLASFISSRFSNLKDFDELSKSQRGALHYLKQFTASFLRNHATWAFEQIQQALENKDQGTIQIPIQEQQVLIQLESKPDDLQKEIESTTEEIAQGNLVGWHNFYTTNKSSDERHLVEIEGKTLEEREKALEELQQKERLPSSIKRGSLIRAFDWLVSVPKEVEQVRMKKNVYGEDFKKLKRGGGLRIFYQMYPSEKKLIFFLHQKKAWTYGF